MARRRKSREHTTNLKHRVLSAAVLIPLSLYIIYAGAPYSLIFGGIVATGIFIEWASLCLKNQLSFWQKMNCIIWGTLYLLLAILWFFQYLSAPEGWKLIYWLLFIVWSTDTAAYVGGKLLKGPKLAPSISPHKTWSGFIIGMIGGTIVGYNASFWLFPGVFNLAGIALLVCFSQVGDILESQVKRWSSVKDSSSIIPGHGGFLDRLDSLLALSFSLALWQALHS